MGMPQYNYGQAQPVISYPVAGPYGEVPLAESPYGVAPNVPRPPPYEQDAPGIPQKY